MPDERSISHSRSSCAGGDRWCTLLGHEHCNTQQLPDRYHSLRQLLGHRGLFSVRRHSTKEIQVTRWAAGLEPVVTEPLSDLPAGNTSKIVSLVRQWDQDASYTKMKNQIGVNWMQLSDSNIIYLNGREYWVAPTTINYPYEDWISRRLIYTHAARIIVIDSHTGEYVTVQQAFGVKAEPSIYYGEEFADDVYVHVPGFEEIGNASYTGAPDHVLSGWQRTLWFLVKESQVGFAFSPPQDDIT